MQRRRAASCYHVVSFYAGDLWRVGKRGEKPPTGFVRGTFGVKRTAEAEAKFLDSVGGEHIFVKAYKCDRAKRLFALNV